MNKKWAIIVELCLLWAALALTGCHRPAKQPDMDISKPPVVIPARHIIAGHSVEKRPIEYYLIGQGPEVIFILAAIHGNETAGISILKQLSEYLQQSRESFLIGRTVILLPVANPDGVENNKRNNANGVDLNRNFSARNRINSKEFGLTPLSEPESYIISQIIRKYDPERIVSMHQVMDTGPEGLATLMPTGCIDYDGPGKMLANQMAKYCDLPVNKLGASPGSLGSYAGETLGIPTITFEMQKFDSNLNPRVLWHKYGQAILAAIIYPEPVEYKQ
jgi:protein MpaA